MVIKMKQVSTSKPFFSSEMIAEATQAASSIVEDKDNPRTTEADWSHAIVSYSMDDLNQQLTQKRTRGLQKKPTKKPTTIRFDEDVLSDLKALGKGWQTQVNHTMREWIKVQKKDSLAH
jgi:uncharacterized protein (DUF4415 family)